MPVPLRSASRSLCCLWSNAHQGVGGWPPIKHRRGSLRKSLESFDRMKNKAAVDHAGHCGAVQRFERRFNAKRTSTKRSGRKRVSESQTIANLHEELTRGEHRRRVDRAKPR